MIRTLLCLPLLASAAPQAHDPSQPQTLLLDFTPSSATVALEIPAPNVIQAYFRDDSQRQPLAVTLNADATEVVLEIPENLRDSTSPIVLETSENSVAYPDGRLIFSALDARVEGPGPAKLESHPGNHRIGFWSSLDNTVVWDFAPTTWGMYQVELTYSLAGPKSEIEVKLADQILTATIQGTGTWYRYHTTTLGRLYFAEDKPTTLSVKGLKKDGGAVMNLKAITLRPAPEGDEPIARPGEGGKVVLSADQATVHGVKLRYEPQPQKHCIGYWTIPTDFATWDFELPEAGNYRVILYQGCGEVQGGSPVNLHLDEQIKPFRVLETGHFQKFVPVEIATFDLAAGRHHLRLQPSGKMKTAVMDVQKLVLVPAK